MSNSLRPHELQHTRPPCPSPTPRVYPNSCPSSRQCHLAISSSVVPFSSCPNPSQHLEVLNFVFSPEQRKGHPIVKVYPAYRMDGADPEHRPSVSLALRVKIRPWLLQQLLINSWCWFLVWLLTGKPELQLPDECILRALCQLLFLNRACS